MGKKCAYTNDNDQKPRRTGQIKRLLRVSSFGLSAGATLVLAHGLGWSVSTLFELSAQNFLGGYVVALIAGARLLKGRLTRAALALLTLGFGIFLASFGASLIYAAFSLVAGFLLAPRQRA
jgi:hypothetical protein